MAKKTVLSAIIDIFSKAPPLVTADLTGQTVVVVGANTGIGFETAKHFAGMNPGKLVLGCRSEEKGKAAVESASSTSLPFLRRYALLELTGLR
jgi:FlaA1/EpsC-like NDP-sugar epimerase